MMTQRQLFFPHNARTANRYDLNDYPGAETGKARPKNPLLQWLTNERVGPLRQSFLIGRSSLLLL